MAEKKFGPQMHHTEFAKCKMVMISDILSQLPSSKFEPILTVFDVAKHIRSI